jgi:hypothetical protein
LADPDGAIQPSEGGTGPVHQQLAPAEPQRGLEPLGELAVAELAEQGADLGDGRGRGADRPGHAVVERALGQRAHQHGRTPVPVHRLPKVLGPDIATGDGRLVPHRHGVAHLLHADARRVRLESRAS